MVSRGALIDVIIFQRWKMTIVSINAPLETIQRLSETFLDTIVCNWKYFENISASSFGWLTRCVNIYLVNIICLIIRRQNRFITYYGYP